MHKLLKAILIGMILLHYNSLYAKSPEKDGKNLIVTIQNSGSDNCTLDLKNIAQGKLLYSNIPTTLPATGESNQFIISGHVVEFSLQYHCGNYKKFSLYMKKYHKKRHKHMSVEAYMFDSNDVFENHKTTPGYSICDSDGGGGVECSGKASKIHWDISN